MFGRSSSHTSDAYSIRAHLIVFALVLVLPIIGFAGFLVWRGAKAEQAQLLEDARQVADQAAIAIDRELTGMLATMQALATSPSIESGSFGAFHRQASSALRVKGAYVSLQDLAGRQIVNTRVPWGSDLPPDRAPEAGRAMVELREPRISDVIVDPLGGEPAILVSVPVRNGDAITHVLSMGVPASHWLRVLEENVVRPDWAADLFDRKNVFIARTRDHDQFAGRPSPEDLSSLSGLAGALTRVSVEGHSVYFAYHRSVLAGWLVGIGVPTDVVLAPWQRSLIFVTASGLALLGLSILMAIAFGARIARPMKQLASSAAQLGRGERVEPLQTGLREVNDVGRNLAAASIGLRERSEALRKSEERYRLATEAFQGAVIDYDAKADHSNRSPRHYEMLGEGPGAIPPTNEGWRERIHPEDRDIFVKARNSIYEDGSPQYEAEYRVRHRNGSWVWVWHRALALRDEKGAVRRVIGAVLDITARRHAEEHLKLLVNELNHRVKNTLATVQSIATQTLRGAKSIDEARTSIEARLIALSSAHNILTRSNWEGASLCTIVAETLAPHRARWNDRISTEGPDIWVSPANAVAISMALYELATNAVKYGALTVESGRVHVGWAIEGEPGAQRARLVWTESGGPAVAVPARQGFGSRLIERSLAADLGGGAKLEYQPEGVVCTLIWPVDQNQSAEPAVYPVRPRIVAR